MSIEKQIDKSEISATISIGKLIGWKFYIPDYQRGYRWGKEEIEDLLDDIAIFMSKEKADEEIYLIQPLVIIPSKQKKTPWLNVVDGQQRLTSIFLIWNYLDPNEEKYELDYQTREGILDFLKSTKKDMEAEENCIKKYENDIDRFHIYSVRKAIEDWFEDKDDDYKRDFLNVLKNKVSFIKYDIANNETESDVFARINIGKIPLTDSELIKGLFLNGNNYSFLGYSNDTISEKQVRIASEWDKIEYTLQNDEFWLFVHNLDKNRKDIYEKFPTRIEYLLDIIADEDHFGVGKKSSDFSKSEKTARYSKVDERKTYRYFKYVFDIELKALREKQTKNKKYTEDEKLWVDILWGKVLNIFHILDEWYHDPTMFHYVGYLITVSGENPEGDKSMVQNLVELWNKDGKNEFIIGLKEKIKDHLKDSKNTKVWIDKLRSYQFDTDNNKGKGVCKDVLLLHNIETMVRQNEYLMQNQKYDLPNFGKFAFHLYKKEEWEVEHIRPNKGDKLYTDKKVNKNDIKLYLTLSLTCLDFTDRQDLKDEIDLLSKSIDTLNDEDLRNKINDIHEKIIAADSGIGEEEKNIIWNYTLLDKSTNAGYGNLIFPLKRWYLLKKEEGKKIVPSKASGSILSGSDIKYNEGEVPFIPPCTKNIFTKAYTPSPTSLIEWNEDDAEGYLTNLLELLNEFLPQQV